MGIAIDLFEKILRNMQNPIFTSDSGEGTVYTIPGLEAVEFISFYKGRPKAYIKCPNRPVLTQLARKCRNIIPAYDVMQKQLILDFRRGDIRTLEQDYRVYLEDVIKIAESRM